MSPVAANDFQSVFVRSTDGLTLHARCIGPTNASILPVVCLPGLTRTANDFDVLAQALASGPRPRRVISLDYRGRGLSDHASDPNHYSPQVELADVITVATALNAIPAIFIGTSRGGILTMMLAVTLPTAIAAAALNDIGPVIELEGLLRIKGYVGKLPGAANFDEAAATLQRLFGTQFPRLTPRDWRASAERAFKNEAGRLVPTYDAQIARTLDTVTPDTQPPSLWLQFDALAPHPLMVIRGALSDLLSRETVEAMRRRHPGLEVVEVPDQGHAPLLADQTTIARIQGFVDAVQP